MAITVLSNLVNPQVMADMIDKKLVDYMRFAPLATVDTTLVGKAGDTITLPVYSYIGDASILGEGSSISCVTLQASTASATVHKLAQGVELTDEAVLSGFGDPLNEAVDQIALSIASELDDEVLAVLASITGTMLYETSASTVAPTDGDIADALEKFGEDIEGDKVAVVPPAVYTSMRKNTNSWIPASELSAERAIKGVVGEYQGCQVIVSNKLKSTGSIYIVKPNALRIFLKRDTQVETDRDITKFTTVITASKHEVCYLYDASGAIKIAKKAN